MPRCKIFLFLMFLLLPASVHALDMSVPECAFTSNPRAPLIDRITDDVDGELVDELFPPPNLLKRISPVCWFEVIAQEGYTDTQALHSIFFSGIKTVYRPFIAVWNEEKGKWKRMVSSVNRSSQIVSAELGLTSGYAAVFVDPADAYEGVASWYRHSKTPKGAATNLFPLGTKLRVTNLETSAQTTVRITSTWTQKNPKRVIDLVSTAFSTIGSLRQGLMHVRIERL
ncbi:MAG: septal ring lytic transglycosylase RlpA family protein [Patescibacteria group bacterium]